MGICSLNQEIKICGVEEVNCMSRRDLTGWNVLSIRSRANDPPFSLPWPSRTKILYFDDVERDWPGDGEFAAKLADIRDALEFSRSIRNEPLLIHCRAGISRSTAIAWLIILDKLIEKPDAVRQSFDIVRKLRPCLSPNRHVLRLGVEALDLNEHRDSIMQQFRECLDELNRQYR
jgi:predicted protein tyrosine phosphatase